MYNSHESNAVFNGANQFHIHHYLSKNQKFIIWTKAELWDWKSFLEDGSQCADIFRFIEIKRDEFGVETLVKDIFRPWFWNEFFALKGKSRNIYNQGKDIASSGLEQVALSYDPN